MYTHVAIVHFATVSVSLYIMCHQHKLQNAIAKSVSVCGVGLHSLWAPDRRLQSVACHHPGDDNCVAKFSVWTITCKCHNWKYSDKEKDPFHRVNVYNYAFSIVRL